MSAPDGPAGGWPGDAQDPVPEPGREDLPAEGMWSEPPLKVPAEPVVEADAIDVPEPVFGSAPDEAAGPPTEPGPPAGGVGPELAGDVEPELAGDGRTLPLRMARLHLRMGSLALARAELEAYAGGGLLDDPALLDLAEARWRTGDLAGAGEAAQAALSRGMEDPLALVIAAESVASVGRPAEARRLAGRALDGLDTALDTLFAGMPRSLIWPADAVPDTLGSTIRPGVEGRSLASAAAAEAFAGGRGALAAGDVPTAALRLSLAIRLDPGFAQGVLAAIGERGAVPLLALVSGDALRLLGREQDAQDAWTRARGMATGWLPPEPAEALADGPADGPDEDDPTT